MRNERENDSFGKKEKIETSENYVRSRCRYIGSNSIMLDQETDAKNSYCIFAP